MLAPGTLNGIADGPLHLAAAASKATGHSGIELLGDGGHGIVRHVQHGLPQVGIAPELGGYAQGNQQIGTIR